MGVADSVEIVTLKQYDESLKMRERSLSARLAALEQREKECDDQQRDLTNRLDHVKAIETESGKALDEIIDLRTKLIQSRDLIQRETSRLRALEQMVQTKIIRFNKEVSLKVHEYIQEALKDPLS